MLGISRPIVEEGISLALALAGLIATAIPAPSLADTCRCTAGRYNNGHLVETLFIGPPTSLIDPLAAFEAYPESSCREVSVTAETGPSAPTCGDLVSQYQTYRWQDCGPNRDSLTNYRCQSLGRHSSDPSRNRLFAEPTTGDHPPHYRYWVDFNPGGSWSLVGYREVHCEPVAAPASGLAPSGTSAHARRSGAASLVAH